MTVTVNASMRCNYGKAPTEADVDAMLSALESRRQAKGYKQEMDSRFYWEPTYKSDDMMFGIFKDYAI